MKRTHQERINDCSNSRVHHILHLIECGSMEWIEYDEKDDRDNHSQRCWKKFRRTQYKVINMK